MSAVRCCCACSAQDIQNLPPSSFDSHIHSSLLLRQYSFPFFRQCCSFACPSHLILSPRSVWSYPLRLSVATYCKKNVPLRLTHRQLTFTQTGWLPFHPSVSFFCMSIPFDSVTRVCLELPFESVGRYLLQKKRVICLPII